MKRLIPLILLGLICAQPLRAQDADSLKFKQVHIGVLLQGNYSGESMYIASPVSCAISEPYSLLFISPLYGW